MASSKRMREEKEVNRANKIDNRRGRTRYPQRPLVKHRQNISNRQLAWSRNARVMASKCVELVRVGCGNKRFAKLRRDFHRLAIQIEKALVKVAQLDRIKAIYLVNQTLPN